MESYPVPPSNVAVAIPEDVFVKMQAKLADQGREIFEFVHSGSPIRESAYDRERMAFPSV